MSLSIDNPSDDARDIRQALASWLDDYIDGRCDRASMKRAFLDVGRSHPEAPWDALALLDQYLRLGRLDASLARELKSEIAQLVFGPVSQPVADQSGDRDGDDTVDTVSDEVRVHRVAPPEAMASSAEAVPPASVDDGVNVRRHERPFKRDSLRSSAPAQPTLLNPASFPSDEPVRMWPDPVDSVGADGFAGDSHGDDAVYANAATFDDEQGAVSARFGSSIGADIQPAVMGAGRRTLNVGDMLRGRYELLAVLGRGSTGIVYQALDRHRAHLSAEARQVAVKVLAGDIRQVPESLARLEREFHQAQSLSHPNVTRMFDLDRDGDTYFIVMELLQGELLSELKARLRGHPMQQQHALGIISAVGAALAHAHRRGIVHGDLRPENIMITRQGEIRVLDFGFAGARDLDLRSAAAMPVTPRAHTAYASVERANGSEPHASDDVYSLACIAYELLSGRHPFGGRSAPLARAHGRQPRRIAGLNNRQMQVLHRALLWARGERSIDVVELLNGLGCGEAPAQLGSIDELSAPADGGGRRRWLILAGVFLLVLAVSSAVAWWVFQGSPPRIVPASVAPPQVQSPASPPPVVTDDAADAARNQDGLAEETTVPVESGEPTTPLAAETSPVTEPARTSARMPVIEFDKDTYVVSEGDGAVRLVIRRTGPVSRDLTFSWVLRPNSALAGSDYADIGPGVERIPAGVREVNLSIPLVQDTIKEGTEMFLAQLQVEDDVAQLGERSSAAIIIVDDD